MTTIAELKVEIKRLKKRAKSAPKLFARIASKEIQVGAYKAARKRLKKGLKTYPEYTVAIGLLAECEEHLGNFDEAKELWEKVYRKDPSHFKAVSGYASHMDKLNDRSNYDRVLFENAGINPFNEDVQGILRRSILMEAVKKNRHLKAWKKQWHPLDFLESGQTVFAIAKKTGIIQSDLDIPENIIPEIDEELVDASITMIEQLEQGLMQEWDSTTTAERIETERIAESIAEEIEAPIEEPVSSEEIEPVTHIFEGDELDSTVPTEEISKAGSIDDPAAESVTGEAVEEETVDSAVTKEGEEIDPGQETVEALHEDSPDEPVSGDLASAVNSETVPPLSETDMDSLIESSGQDELAEPAIPGSDDETEVDDSVERESTIPPGSTDDLTSLRQESSPDEKVEDDSLVDASRETSGSDTITQDEISALFESTSPEDAKTPGSEDDEVFPEEELTESPASASPISQDEISALFDSPPSADDEAAEIVSAEKVPEVAGEKESVSIIHDEEKVNTESDETTEENLIEKQVISQDDITELFKAGREMAPVDEASPVDDAAAADSESADTQDGEDDRSLSEIVEETTQVLEDKPKLNKVQKILDRLGFETEGVTDFEEIVKEIEGGIKPFVEKPDIKMIRKKRETLLTVTEQPLPDEPEEKSDSSATVDEPGVENGGSGESIDLEQAKASVAEIEAQSELISADHRAETRKSDDPGETSQPAESGGILEETDESIETTEDKKSKTQDKKVRLNQMIEQYAQSGDTEEEIVPEVSNDAEAPTDQAPPEVPEEESLADEEQDPALKEIQHFEAPSDSETIPEEERKSDDLIELISSIDQTGKSRKDAELEKIKVQLREKSSSIGKDSEKDQDADQNSDQKVFDHKQLFPKTLSPSAPEEDNPGEISQSDSSENEEDKSGSEFKGPFTRTMAELFITQGKLDYAQSVVDKLRKKFPDDPSIESYQKKIDEERAKP